ncbi:MAG TPA: LysM peptidoglycan-binding domain-containing protein [Candidatus Limnocylindria bacterium]|nr:LysM peptidoglycan-binding domain-containing protein [Candidatus Limnocylindria bacterium]
MRDRPGRLMTAAGAMALTIVCGPLLAPPVLAADPTVVVRPGDTLGGIAARYGVSIDRLAALNQLANPDLIEAGQRLRLPAQPATHATTRTVVHVVQYGERLTGIAERYGTTIAAIVAANHLPNANLIFAGQRLTIPTRVVTPTTGASSASSVVRTAPYTIRAGDTLTAIAGRYHTTVSRLASLNQLADASLIFAGQVILVPLAAPARPDWSIRRFDAPTRQLMGAQMAVRDAIVVEARRAHVPPPLALAVAWQESGWRQGVVSSAGAIGVMQLLPDTADWVGLGMLGSPLQIDSMRDNVRGGVMLLRHYLVRYAGDQGLALAAYYQGQRAVDTYGIFPSSRPYIDSIVNLEGLFAP